MMSEPVPDPLTPGHFEPHVHKTFRVRGGRHVLTLDRIETRKLADWEAKILPRQPFNLIFRGGPGDVLNEGMHVLEVDGGPTFALYVIPIHTPVRDRQDYQSVFN